MLLLLLLVLDWLHPDVMAVGNDSSGSDSTVGATSACGKEAVMVDGRIICGETHAYHCLCSAPPGICFVDDGGDVVCVGAGNHTVDEVLGVVVMNGFPGKFSCMARALSPFVSTKGTTNYARRCRLLVDVGSHVLRSTFDKIHPPATLHTVLGCASVRHTTLQSQYKGNKCSIPRNAGSYSLEKMQHNFKDKIEKIETEIKDVPILSSDTAKGFHEKIIGEIVKMGNELKEVKEKLCTLAAPVAESEDEVCNFFLKSFWKNPRSNEEDTYETGEPNERDEGKAGFPDSFNRRKPGSRLFDIISHSRVIFLNPGNHLQDGKRHKAVASQRFSKSQKHSSTSEKFGACVPNSRSHNDQVTVAEAAWCMKVAGDIVADSIVSTLEEVGLNKEQFLSMGSDGANVNKTIWKSLNKHLKHIYMLINAVLTLFHGNAAVEQSLSIDKQAIRANRTLLTHESLSGIRQVKDAVTATDEKIHVMDFSTELISCTRKAYYRYRQRLEEQKKQEEAQKNERVRSEEAEKHKKIAEEKEFEERKRKL
ncbi:hypothetical protein AWC38_SpisGene16678 [Stylophora pistillata]|uniref:Uncharacterized protein n=1 Tax=Stylophora pistillata TaxID=50429 RepID=A0A2B4RQ62_STYPI|nr:hypothetical protein AWC38_SpisGene16678 [Stylophora pistillata]